MESSRLAIPSVTASVYGYLRERIVEGQLEPGSRINVDEVATELGVSRMPIHDALNQLSAEGLVDVQPRKGTFVSSYTTEDIAETLDIRRALELLACESAIVNSTDADIESLNTVMNSIEESVAAATSPAEMAQLHDRQNFAFHHKIVELSGNRRLLAIYDNLRAHLRIAYAHLSTPGWPERLASEREDHEEILLALKRRDLPRLQAVMERHLRRSRESLLNDLRSEGRQM